MFVTGITEPPPLWLVGSEHRAQAPERDLPCRRFAFIVHVPDEDPPHLVEREKLESQAVAVPRPIGEEMPAVRYSEARLHFRPKCKHHSQERRKGALVQNVVGLVPRVAPEQAVEPIEQFVPPLR